MSTGVLDVRDVQKSFGSVTAAKDISVTVPQGAVYSLIGTNGAGKTTFVNIVTGYIKPDSGTINFGGRNIAGLAPRQITRLGIHRSFQIVQLCNELTVEENMLVAGAIHGRSRPSFLRRAHDAEARDRAIATLERFNIAEHRDRLIPELSGGVKKLLDIAMAMAGETQIMLLDEPTSGVATDEKFPIMDLVIEALRAEEVTVIFVEHDMDIVTRYSERVLAFYDGRLIAERCAQRGALGSRSAAICDRGSDMTLKLENIEVTIQAAPILRGVSLEVGTGERMGLVGRNGAGKTTVMRTITGLATLAGGKVLWNGEDISAMPPRDRARLGFGYMPEDRRLVTDLTVEENMLLPAWANEDIDGTSGLAFVYDLMPELTQMASRKALLLSGGQQKMVALGRALIAGKRLLLLDEPFEGVAPALAKRISEVITSLKGEGLSVLIAQSELSHSLDLLQRESVIERGEIVEVNVINPTLKEMA